MSQLVDTPTAGRISPMPPQGAARYWFRVTTFQQERVPVPAQALALGAGVRQISFAGGWARRSGTLAYVPPAIRVASLLWSIGETCVDA